METLLALMKKHNLLSGEIVDYFWRDKSQQQETPHTHHGGVHKRRSDFGPVHSASRICEFADRYVNTSAAGISAKNLEGQNHKHSAKYCLRKCDQGRASYCRFGFPNRLC
jgi:hypothetical protein